MRRNLAENGHSTVPGFVKRRIFKRVFLDGGNANPLFLIGDPKQAIYGFRGADVVSYLQAVESAGTRAGLATNWRSDAPLVRALDTVFEGGVFLPATVIGRGGFSPAQPVAPAPVAPESLGITGRSLEALYYVCQGLPNKSIARPMGIEEGMRMLRDASGR